MTGAIEHLTTKGYMETKKDIDEVISLLQQGEKYEAIVDELDREYGREHHFYAIRNERFCTGNEIIVYLSQTIKELEQKYFPKTGEQTPIL